MNDKEKVKRSQVGVELVRLLASEGDRIFTTARARELAPQVGIKYAYLWEALHHLKRNGWIVPLRRGLYAISSTVPGVTPVHEYEIAMSLVNPAAVAFRSALHFHGLSDQMSNRIFILTTTETTVPRKRNTGAGHTEQGIYAGNATYRFVQVKPERFFGTEKVWIGEARVTVTDPERTLLDGLSMPQHCGDFTEVLHAFETRGSSLDIDRIIHYALRLDTAVVKRLGWVLENRGFNLMKLDVLATLPVKGYRKLDPTGPWIGHCNNRWKVRENLPGKVML